MNTACGLKIPPGSTLQQKYPVKKTERVIFMLDVRGALHTHMSGGVEDQAHMGAEQMGVPRQLLQGAPVGSGLAASTSLSENQQNAVEMFCDHSNACVALSAFVKRPVKESKTLKSCVHIFDRLVECNAVCGVEGYIFKLQS